MKFFQISTEIPSNLDVSWFDNFELPDFKTADVIGFEIRACDSIIYTNENGQVVNIARSTGTDYDNRDKISTSIQSNGMQVDVLPPVILNNGTSVDGFTRGASLKKLGMQEWIYLVVDLKEGSNIEDLKDEIGLGCNNHSPSKPATLDDFESRLRCWIGRQESTPTVDECIVWWNCIPHSFTQKGVRNRCEKVISNVNSKKSMISFNVEDGRRKVEEILKDKLSGTEYILPINYNGKSNNTYMQRSFCQALEAVSRGQDVLTIGMVNNVTAERADEERKKLKREIAKYNKIFRAAATRYNNDPDFELFDLGGFLPQKLDEEDPTQLV
tara:strand:+ start:202 stop:1182 length:981 start_codon:yes stop_codon:yes gene_type:complete